MPGAYTSPCAVLVFMESSYLPRNARGFFVFGGSKHLLYMNLLSSLNDGNMISYLVLALPAVESEQTLLVDLLCVG